MTAGGADALDHALELRARPEMLARLRQWPLPDAVLLLIRIAAGDRQAMQAATARTSVEAETLVDTSTRYLRQVLFAPDADNYRLLGVREDADDDALKEHYRWLMRWLHPDRDPERGGESDAQRVNRAWHVLRSDERRHAYDRQRQRQRQAPRLRPNTQARPIHRHRPAPQAPRPTLSPRAVHVLPALVLGGMALLAGGSLAAWHWLDQTGDTGFVSELRTHRGPSGVVPAPIAHRDAANASARPATLHAAVAAMPVAAEPKQEAAVNSSRTAAATASVARPAPPTIAAMRVAPATADAAPEPTSAKTVDQAETAATARAITDRTDADSSYAAVAVELANAYAQGDLDRMMGLFDPAAFDDEQGRSKVADQYQRLFRQTGSRRLGLGELAWSAEEGRVVGTGRFDARIRRHGHAYARHQRGRIVLELVPVGDQWKIHRLALEKDAQ